MTTPPASATTPLGDLLRQIASRGAPGERSPLIHSGEITLPDAAPLPLPLDPELMVAWRALLGETGLAWQSEALNAARRGAGLALCAAPPLGPATLLLLVAEQIRSQAGGTVLLLAPDDALLHDLASTVRNVDALLGGGMPHLVIGESTRPARRPVPLLLMTFDTLHRRLLRSHDRAWATLWPDLRAVLLPAVDDAAGAAVGHVRWLLRRVNRLRPQSRPLPVLASLRPVPDPAATLAALLDQPPPVVTANTARLPLTWAIWRGAPQPVAAAIELAAALRAAGVTAQLGGRSSLERATLARAGAERGVAVGSLSSAITPALVVPGLLDGAALPSLAAVGYQLVVMISDEAPAAQVIERQPALLTPASPLAWPISAANAYVGSAHLRCAAEERPLQAGELGEWQALELVERLESRRELARLPGAQSWQPVAGAPDYDSYADLDPASAGSATVAVLDEAGQELARVDATTLERQLYPGADVNGAQVSGWGDDGAVTVRVGQGGRTAPERRTRVTIREQVAERSLDGGRADLPLRVGKVVVSEEITARRVLMSDRTVRRTPFDPPLRVQWSAPALWIVSPPISSDAGRTLAGVLPLLLRCSAADLVPCVDQDTLYLVEAQPGGRGLVDLLYMQFEGLLQLAAVAARALSKDPLWGAGAKADLTWMEAILMPLAEPLLLDPPAALPAPVQPAPERRTRTSMIATPEEVAARRAAPRREPAAPREAPPPPVVPAPAKPGNPLGAAPPPPASVAPGPDQVSGLPAQPMRLAAQPPAPQREAQPPRPATRTEPPPPPSPEPRGKTAPRPARRRATSRQEPRPALRSGSRQEPLADQVTPAPKPGAAPPKPASPAVSSPAAPGHAPKPAPPNPLAAPKPAPPAVPPLSGTLPARREPPPLERPPFQTAPPSRPAAGRGAASEQPASQGALPLEAAPRPVRRDEPPPPQRDPSRGAGSASPAPARTPSGQREEPPPPARESSPPARRAEPPPPARAQEPPAPRRDPAPPAGHRAEPPPARRADPPPASQREPSPPARRADPPPARQPWEPERRESPRPAARSEPAGQRAESPRPARRDEPARQDPPRPARRGDPPQAPAGRRDNPRAAAGPPPATPASGFPAEPPARQEPGARWQDQRPAGRAEPSPPARREEPRPPARQEPPPIETSSDPAALLAKARRLREQREAELRREQKPPPVRQPIPPAAEDEAEVVSRFSPGDRVFCVPYGEGEVRKTRVRDGRELLLVAFPELGELRVDTAVNAVRLIAPDEDQTETEDYA